MTSHELNVSVRVLPDGHKHAFRVSGAATLLEVMHEGARRADVTLLPAPARPLDRLHDIGQHHQIGPAIKDLDQPASDYVKQPGHSNDFGIELVLAIRLNTQWEIAPQPAMSPREILALFGLHYEEYTLYRPMCTEPLPLDTAIVLHRGDAFEAQRDGKYGAEAYDRA